MPDWIRVKDKTTKHEFTIDRANLTDAVTEIKKKATGAVVLGPTPHVSLNKAKKADESSTPADGNAASTTKEKGSDK